MARQVVDGTLYNTETATELARGISDFHGQTRCLYRTLDGRYFLYEVTVSFRVDGTRRSDLMITPLAVDDAIREYHLLVRELSFEEAFPDADLTDR